MRPFLASLAVWLLLIAPPAQAMTRFVQKAGECTILGLSTDTKPTNPPDNYLFLEMDTGKFFFSASGAWTEKLNAGYHAAGTPLLSLIPASGDSYEISVNAGVLSLADTTSNTQLMQWTAAHQLLLPSYNCTTKANGGKLTTGADGKVFCDDAAGGGGSGTVTAITQGTNMTFSVNPITTTGTINLSATPTVSTLTLSTTTPSLTLSPSSGRAFEWNANGSALYLADTTNNRQLEIFDPANHWYLPQQALGILSVATSQGLVQSVATTGTGNVVMATAPVLNKPTIGIVGTRASAQILAVGTAPTCTFSTGGGTGPSCALETGSTDLAGTMTLTTGSGSPGSTGTITLTFNNAMGVNSPVCLASLTAGATDWQVNSTVRVTTQSTTAPVFSWASASATAAVALTASTNYKISYVCIGK